MHSNYSILIPVYNEGEKPLKLLETIDENISNLEDYDLESMYFIASGNIDKIKENISNHDLPIQLIEQNPRGGKAHAINVGLKNIDSDIVIMISGDVFLDKHTLDKILKSFDRENVGGITCRPQPMCSDDYFLGYYKNLIWDLHHRISKIEPKAGEIFSFLNIIDNIPDETVADEEYLKNIIYDNDYNVEYISDAYVYNQGPDNLLGLFEQRKRVYLGHLFLHDQIDYTSPTLNLKNISKIFFEYIKDNGIEKYLIPSILFEISSRAYGAFCYYILHEENHIWKKVE